MLTFTVKFISLNVFEARLAFALVPSLKVLAVS